MPELSTSVRYIKGIGEQRAKRSSGSSRCGI